MSDFHFQEMFELGVDETPYRKLTSEHVSTAEFEGQRILKVEAEALTELAAQAMRDVSHLFRPGHLAQLRAILDDPEASANDRFVVKQLLENAVVAAEMVLPSCQDTGTAIVLGKKGQNVWTSVQRRGGHLPRHPPDLHRDQSALLAAGAPLHLRREEHRHESPGADRYPRHAGGRVQVPLRRQGRRLRQQDLPVPADAGGPGPGAAAEIPGGEDAGAGYGRLPAVPPGHRHRRHLGGARAQDREARELPLPRWAPHQRRRVGPRLPRPRAREAGGGHRPEDRHRRPVRGQVLLPRRARDPAAAPWGLVPDRAGRLLLRRPPDQGQDHRRGGLRRAARDQPGAFPARDEGGDAQGPRGGDRPQPADGRDPRHAVEVPDQDAPLARRARSSWRGTSPTRA